jgi:Zn finger protein HypA/HybF involved in hydrogenase expression
MKIETILKKKQAFIEKAQNLNKDLDYMNISYASGGISGIKCNKCGLVFKQRTKNGCPSCTRSLGLDGFIIRAKQLHGNKYDYSETQYDGIRTPLKINCVKCSKYFWQKPTEHLAGHGCPFCANNCKRLTLQRFLERAEEIHKGQYDYSSVDYQNNADKVSIKCLNCNTIFLQPPRDHLRNHGCPYCRSSKAEQEVERFLIASKIKYEKQKTFKDCKYIRNLKFDFYLPELNVLIEVDGPQHFGPVEWYKATLEEAKKFFELQQFKDSIKSEYCKHNQIKLFRIPTWEVTEKRLQVELAVWARHTSKVLVRG